MLHCEMTSFFAGQSFGRFAQNNSTFGGECRHVTSAAAAGRLYPVGEYSGYSSTVDRFVVVVVLYVQFFLWLRLCVEGGGRGELS